MSDEKFKLIEYTHPNRGDHMVIGAATGTKYGYRGGGSRFLVHVDDIRLQPDFFRVIEQAPEPPPAPPVAPGPPPPPEPVAEPEPVTVPDLSSQITDFGHEPEPLAAPEPLPAIVTEVEPIPGDELGTTSMTIGNQEVETVDAFSEVQPEEETPKLNDPVAVLDLRQNVIQTLIDAGFTSVGKIIEAGLEDLTAIKGIGMKTAVDVREKAEQWAFS